MNFGHSEQVRFQDQPKKPPVKVVVLKPFMALGRPAIVGETLMLDFYAAQDMCSLGKARRLETNGY